jgi:hypothetical protein
VFDPDCIDPDSSVVHLFLVNHSAIELVDRVNAMEKFRICLRTGIVDALKAIDDRNYVILGIAQDDFGALLFDIESVDIFTAEALHLWYHEPDSILRLWSAVRSDTKPLPLVGYVLEHRQSLTVTVFESRMDAMTEDNDCPDAVLESESIEEFDSLLDLIRFLAGHTNWPSCSQPKVSPLVNAFSRCWYESEPYHDYQGIRDGSTVFSTYHLDSELPLFTQQLIAAGYQEMRSR